MYKTCIITALHTMQSGIRHSATAGSGHWYHPGEYVMALHRR